MAGFEDTRATVIQRCEEHFARLYPSLDKSRTVMCPPIFEFGYQAPIEEKAAGYSPPKQIALDSITGDEAEQQVFRALQDCSVEPMFVIRDLKFTPFLQSILGRSIAESQLDFVIIDWNIGVLLVEVKSKDNKKKYRKAKTQLDNGENIIKEVIVALQSQQRIDRYDHVNPTNVGVEINSCQTQVEIETQSNASKDATTTTKPTGETNTEDHVDEPAQETSWTQRMPQDDIPVYRIYAVPNNELYNCGSSSIPLESTSLKNIPDWLKSNFSMASFKKDHQELLHKLCSVLVGQKTEVTTSGQTQFSDKVLPHKLQKQIHGVIDSQRFLKQSHDASKNKNRTEHQERNVVSTKDQPHLSILADQFLYLNKEQLAVWEGPRHQVIDGTTGSGKTILLKYMALACARKGEQVCVYVPEQLLTLYKIFFQEHDIDEHTVTVQAFEPKDEEGMPSFLLDDKKHHVFIDEFQLNLHYGVRITLELLEEILQKKSQMYYWIACDKMQLTPGLSAIPEGCWAFGENYRGSILVAQLQDWLCDLQRLGFHRTELNTCVRSTRNIQDFLQWYVGHLKVILPEGNRPVFPGHNIPGDTVHVYFVEEGHDQLSKDDLPSCSTLCGTIPASDLGGIPYNGIAEVIKKEIDSSSLAQSYADSAVLFPMFDVQQEKMFKAMTDQGIPVSRDLLSDSNEVYFNNGIQLHSYQWKTVIVICGSEKFLDKYTMFTRAILKLVVIFHPYDNPFLPTSLFKSVSAYDSLENQYVSWH